MAKQPPKPTVAGEHKQLAVDKIKPNPWNYNVQKGPTFTKLVANLRKFGFVEPILVRQKNGHHEIVNGEHRWRAAKQTGMTKIPVIDLGKLSDADAKQLTIILNELSGTPDEVRLAELLQDINTDIELDDLLQVMPFAPPELDMYLEEMNFSFDNLSTEDTKPPKTPEEETPPDATDDLPDATRFIIAFDGKNAESMATKLSQIDEDPAKAVKIAVDAWAKAQKAKKKK